MNDIISDKDPRIHAIVRAMVGIYGPNSFEITDHWGTVLDAIGISRADNSAVLTYIAVHDLPPRFYVELELPPPAGSDLPYELAGDHSLDDMETVLRIVGEHLGLKEVQNGIIET